MQITREKFEELSSEAESWKERCKRSEELNQRQAHQIETFNSILDKIVRAARGLPIIMNRDMDSMVMNGSYMGDNHGHQCTIPGELEVLRRELSLSHMTVVTLETQLASAVAIAEFAKEHKS
jgi:hypothetical protein